MKPYFSLLIMVFTLFMGILAMTACNSTSAAPTTPLAEKSLYDFTMKDIDKNDVKMEQYKGKVLLIVNVASQCGYTPQYQGLQKIYSQYKDQGFTILGFPANNFGEQEPGSNEEIKTFCTTKYQVTFPIFSKISVVGGDKHPFYRFLTEKATDPEFAGDISWNFNKFLVDKTGKIVARFDSGVTPESPTLTGAIEKALK